MGEEEITHSSEDTVRKSIHVEMLGLGLLTKTIYFPQQADTWKNTTEVFRLKRNIQNLSCVSKSISMKML